MKWKFLVNVSLTPSSNPCNSSSDRSLVFVATSSLSSFILILQRVRKSNNASRCIIFTVSRSIPNFLPSSSSTALSRTASNPLISAPPARF
uniref:Guanine nucleotide-exchange, putative n=1 Tax=Arundo donax TaxID=35708 RepID=A0A0A9R5V6_ARUDO